MLGRSSYSAAGWRPEDVNALIDFLRHKLPAFMRGIKADCVVVRGSSGDIIGYPLWLRNTKHNKINVIIARKKGAAGHSPRLLCLGADWVKPNAALMIDDFVSTGETVEGVKRDLDDADVRLAGVLTYQNWEHFNESNYITARIGPDQADWKPKFDNMPYFALHAC